MYAPVTSRGEAIGVLELTLRQEAPTESVRASVAVVAHALAYVVIANRRFTDLFEWGQRSLPPSLEGEIQHRLLPGSYTCEGGQFTLAGWLEPAGDMGGDTFDFSLERDTLHVSMTDAMGHTLEAALLATVLIAALRNARRRGMSLGQQAQFAQAALAGYATDGAFVTGQLARVDLGSGLAQLINAGHPAPFLVRGGIPTRVALDAEPPFGLADQEPHHVQQLQLEPNDRLVFLTDGLLERQAASIDLASLFLGTLRLHPREAAQQVVQAVAEACRGELADDATILILDWYGGPSTRDSNAGADIWKWSVPRS